MGDKMSPNRSKEPVEIVWGAEQPGCDRMAARMPRSRNRSATQSAGAEHLPHRMTRCLNVPRFGDDLGMLDNKSPDVHVDA